MYPSFRPLTPFLSLPLLALSLLAIAACGSDDDLDSNEGARRAYLGLDKSVEKSLKLGFDGFNAASSANIPAQMAPGNEDGTLLISGQVDQGNSANKGMRLRVGMIGYSDGPFVINEDGDKIEITYSTAQDAAVQPALTLKLNNIPTGTFDGSVVGQFTMTGGIEGTVTLNLKLEGQLEDAGGGVVRRKAGSTKVFGTAVSGKGTYDINIVI